MCKENESAANHGSRTEHADSLGAPGENREGSDASSTSTGGDRHPHEPPVLIEDGSFIIECDEDIIADGPGGVYDPVTGDRRKKHKRRTPTGTTEKTIACVRVEGGEIALPDEVTLTDPIYKLLIAFGVHGIRVTYPRRGCKIKIYWSDHPCAPENP